jgi:hypothetical protein
MRIPRWPALVLLLAAAVGLVLFDRRDPTTERSELTVESTPPLPVAAGADARASTWYCAGGTGVEGGVADHTVVVVNPTDEIVSGTIEVFGTEVLDDVSPIYLEPIEEPIEIAPQSSISIRLGDISAAAHVAALVEVASGSVVVEHAVAGPTGTDQAPCASSASDGWYFPAGSTSRDARQVISVFNPFPDDAVVDVTFATDDGNRAPQRFDGVPVPAGTLVPLDVTEVVARWDQLSLAVETRVGRVVADRLVTYDGTTGLTGLTLASGVPRAAPVWVFAAGIAAPGVSQSYAIYNPSPDQPAEVDLEIRLDSPETNGAVEPFELTIPPRRRIVVAVNRDDVHPVSGTVTVDTDTRVPPGVGHSVTVRSFNGVPVAVEQLTTSVDGASGVALGVASVLGAPATATSLVLELGPAPRRHLLALMNPSFSTIARVNVSLVVDGEITPLDGFDDVEIGPQRRLEIPDLVEAAGAQPTLVLIEASSGVVAQLVEGQPGALGLRSSIGIPVGGKVEIPELFG